MRENKTLPHFWEIYVISFYFTVPVPPVPSVHSVILACPRDCLLFKCKFNFMRFSGLWGNCNINIRERENFSPFCIVMSAFILEELGLIIMTFLGAVEPPIVLSVVNSNLIFLVSKL